MFTERELLIMSYCVDKIAAAIAKEEDLTFFSAKDAGALCYKIHNVLRATRQQDADKEMLRALNR